MTFWKRLFGCRTGDKTEKKRPAALVDDAAEAARERQRREYQNFLTYDGTAQEEIGG